MSPTFVLDAHLGRLARYLRMLGLDAWFSAAYTDPELQAIARQGGRVLLSRDRLLVASLAPAEAHLVRAVVPREQLVEIVARFDLKGHAAPLSRCIDCNARLEPAGRDEVLSLIPETSRADAGRLARCPACRKVYWQGSHYRRMTAFVAEVLGPE